MKLIKKILKTIGISIVGILIITFIMQKVSDNKLAEEEKNIVTLIDNDMVKLTTDRNKENVLKVPTAFGINIENKSDQFLIVDISDYKIDGQAISVKGGMTEYLVEQTLSGKGSSDVEKYKGGVLNAASAPVKYSQYENNTTEDYLVYTLDTLENGRQKEQMNNPTKEITFTLKVYSSEDSTITSKDQLKLIEEKNITLKEIE